MYPESKQALKDKIRGLDAEIEKLQRDVDLAKVERDKALAILTSVASKLSNARDLKKKLLEDIT